MTGTAAFRVVVDALERLSIPYFVTGSLASSVHGTARATMDIDIVAALEKQHVFPLVAALSPDFYADQLQIEEALRAGRSFNLIHLASSFKFDIFPLHVDPFAESQMDRRVRAIDQPVPFWCATAEDTVLSKLVWYRAGAEVSERQWSDIRGILAVQQDRLDREYLDRWARHLGVEDLLERAIASTR